MRLELNDLYLVQFYALSQIRQFSEFQGTEGKFAITSQFLLEFCFLSQGREVRAQAKN